MAPNVSPACTTYEPWAQAGPATRLSSSATPTMVMTSERTRRQGTNDDIPSPSRRFERLEGGEAVERLVQSSHKDHLLALVGFIDKAAQGGALICLKLPHHG